jgi:multidrug transporter EmrE-like cation transporter
MTDATIISTTKDKDTETMSVLALIIGSAVLYGAAMILMKYWGQIPPVLILTGIAALMAGGVYFEIGALQTERLGMVYVLILGLEVIVIALASIFLFGETFSWKEITGGALILAGTAVAWS